MHNPIPTAIKKHPNSRHVEIIISHYFTSANHTALFSRDSPAIGELDSFTHQKIFLLARQKYEGKKYEILKW